MLGLVNNELDVSVIVIMALFNIDYNLMLLFWKAFFADSFIVIFILEFIVMFYF